MQGGATLAPRDRRSRGAGLHARQTVLAHGHSFGLFDIIASVQRESAPEDWSAVLLQRISGSTPQFISALVDAMRKDLNLPPLP